MLTSIIGNESLKAYIERINYIIFLIENNSDEEKYSIYISDLREDLQNVLLKIQRKSYQKYQTLYWKHVYLPAIKEAQLNTYLRLGSINLHTRWLNQLIQVKAKLEWYLKLGENSYYADIQ